MQVRGDELKREAEAVVERLSEMAASAEAAGRKAAGRAEEKGAAVLERASEAGGEAATGLSEAGRAAVSGAAGAGGALVTGATAVAAMARLLARLTSRQAKRTYRLRRAARPLAMIVGWILVYRRWGRAWVRGWGAAGPEEQAMLPGDRIVPNPKRSSTRAVTIEAAPAAVWPWLVQLGQGRGGLYSYDWLENMLGCGVHSADTILPEHQQLSPGDRVRLVRPGYSVDLCLEVAEVKPGEALVLRSPGEPADAAQSSLPWASWAFVLHPLTQGRTRLLVRWRSDFADSPGSRFWNDWGIELPHFLMERKMMLGIKERAEGRAAGGEGRG
jgi:hypothetical protein